MKLRYNPREKAMKFVTDSGKIIAAVGCREVQEMLSPIDLETTAITYSMTDPFAYHRDGDRIGHLKNERSSSSVYVLDKNDVIKGKIDKRTLYNIIRPFGARGLLHEDIEIEKMGQPIE